MRLTFICPMTKKMYETERYRLTDNTVKMDDFGGKYLAGMVELTSPCPHCGQYHKYIPSKISCPFEK